MSAQADMLQYETQARSQGLRFIFGLDEAGRGPLAGPVVAAAVCLKEYGFKIPINDSKQMKPQARINAFHEIYEKAYVGIGIIGEAAIDQINILNASLMAMEMAVVQLVRNLPCELNSHENFAEQVLLLVDGNVFKSQLSYKYKTIIDGDCKSLSIACASVIAKVYRDRILDAYDQIFPEYGFAQHKGYGTKAHYQALKTYGASSIHRKTFQGVL